MRDRSSRVGSALVADTAAPGTAGNAIPGQALCENKKPPRAHPLRHCLCVSVTSTGAGTWRRSGGGGTRRRGEAAAVGRGGGEARRRGGAAGVRRGGGEARRGGGAGAGGAGAGTAPGR